MIRAVLLLVLLIGITAYAEDNKNYTNELIIGAFGLHLGDILTDELADQINIKDTKESNGCITYTITPLEPFATFDKYELTIAAKSRKIAKIEARIYSDTKSSTLFMFTSQELRKKYGDFQIKKEFTSDGVINSASIFERNLKNRCIYLFYSYPFLSLSYYDTQIINSEALSDKTNTGKPSRYNL